MMLDTIHIVLLCVNRCELHEVVANLLFSNIQFKTIFYIKIKFKILGQQLKIK